MLVDEWAEERVWHWTASRIIDNPAIAVYCPLQSLVPSTLRLIERLVVCGLIDCWQNGVGESDTMENIRKVCFLFIIIVNRNVKKEKFNITI